MNKDYTILVVDDEEDIIELLSYNLKKEGFTVHTASDGKMAIKKAKEIIPDLILLDVMMPEMDGIETCGEIRAEETLASTLIAFLTARGEDYSQIAGFDAGADDYITKPIKPKVLISRINALLRRVKDDNKQAETSVTLQVDRERYVVIKQDVEISVPRKEFELLALLLSKPGKVFSRETILNVVWGQEVVVGDRTIDVHIRKLREKIGDETIKTVKGVGYKLQLE
ncbi:MAG: response regulator transcription factor [Crocinitomicaceae bacterium]|jgi:two-component system alkaline phosphatase synthesis response regulator PhoP|nr:response regulator transcription factor [Crocinitomicaceae bacterium]MBT5404026.1 response regulator transcription factor [Crocinitomicaceae bacterium]MBT6029209.1 response regulator transcription factor [Crocinitomicaceae bacterium]MBT6514285.1 response regulator transcription factor [Crocinitomicaceae bacterium]MDG2330994.1 response regulator transcription factor [Flavobacteriales bacterium]